MIKITCYGKTETWDDRKKAIDFYNEAVAWSDGCERERYMNILLGLYRGDMVCSDGVD